jgi:hypothetical protein
MRNPLGAVDYCIFGYFVGFLPDVYYAFSFEDVEEYVYRSGMLL